MSRTCLEPSQGSVQKAIEVFQVKSDLIQGLGTNKIIGRMKEQTSGFQVLKPLLLLLIQSFWSGCYSGSFRKLLPSQTCPAMPKPVTSWGGQQWKPTIEKKNSHYWSMFVWHYYCQRENVLCRPHLPISCECISWQNQTASRILAARESQGSNPQFSNSFGTQKST